MERPAELMTLEEVADWLKVPKATLYNWRSRGDGPRGVRVGRYVRYRVADVEAWLAQRDQTGEGTDAA